MRWLDRVEIRLVFFAHLGLYLILAIYLGNIGFHTPDSLLTSGKAMLAMTGSEPKLAHVGFVTPPLFAVASMITALLTFLQGFLLAPKLLSALLAAWLVSLLHQAMRDEDVEPWQRFSLVLAFSLNPLFVYWATTGQDGSAFLLLYGLFLSSFLNAVERKRLYHLFYAGLALGLAFFTAYETILVAILSLLYLFLSLRKEGDVPPDRARTVYASVYLPLLYGIILWIGMNWVIMGDPLYFVGDSYARAAATLQRFFESPAPGGMATAAFGLAVGGVAAVSPLYFLLGLFVHGRALLLLSLPVVVYGLGLFLGRSSIPFGSYVIAHLTAFPLALFAPRPSFDRSRGQSAVLWLLFLSVVVSIPSTFYWMGEFPVGNYYEREFRDVLFLGQPAPEYAEERELNTYLEEKLAWGPRILLDDLLGYSVIAFSRQPSVFITPGHSLFREALENPQGAKVNYLLVPDPRRPPAERDAINRAYPGLYLDGRSGFTLEKAFRAWKLFRVEGQR